MSTPVRAHGAQIEVLQHPAIEIVATFDTGAPMANAQVAVYAPNALETPWKTGRTDNEGRFSFMPDVAEGTWEVTVRKAGHGQTTTFALSAASDARAPDANVPAPRQWLSMAAVVWGFIGTALYFTKKDFTKKDLTLKASRFKDSPKGDSVATPTEYR
ncbi:MAG: carboxypeptidase-like regulatory domain-containing protein [Cyanobacteria bacterium P01_D01_bin.105]